MLCSPESVPDYLVLAILCCAVAAAFAVYCSLAVTAFLLYLPVCLIVLQSIIDQ